jgi:hypothetical protein
VRGGLYDVWRTTEDNKALASLKRGMSAYTEGPARRVARWTIANLYDPTGYFYYQKTRWYTNRIPYVRWSQAHMFAALGSLAAAPRQ